MKLQPEFADTADNRGVFNIGENMDVITRSRKPSGRSAGEFKAVRGANENSKGV